MFARFFVSEARAGSPSLPGVSSVGAGVTVSLIQIDNNGNQVGAAIATATTDASGNYTLTTPVGFTPGPNYVVVASSGGTSIRSFATGTSVDVNPYSHTTVALITGTVSGASGQITNVSIADIDTVQQTVLQTSGDVSTTSTTATALTTALQGSINNNIESNNIVNSITAAGTITGNVTDSGGAPVAGRPDHGPHLRRPDNDGYYQNEFRGELYRPRACRGLCRGAINDTSTSTAASQWWTSTGGTTSAFFAEKISVGATPVTTNFSPPDGGRVSGTVTAAATGGTLPGIQVTLCDFSTGQTLMWVTTNPDGAYTFNVAPGAYFLTFRNQTLAEYGTGIWNSTIPGGGTNKTQAEKIVVTAGAIS